MMSAIAAGLESGIGVSVIRIATSDVYPTGDWLRVQLWLLNGALLAQSGKHMGAPKPVESPTFAPCSLA